MEKITEPNIYWDFATQLLVIIVTTNRDELKAKTVRIKPPAPEQIELQDFYAKLDEHENKKGPDKTKYPSVMGYGGKSLSQVAQKAVGAVQSHFKAEAVLKTTLAANLTEHLSYVSRTMDIAGEQLSDEVGQLRGAISATTAELQVHRVKLTESIDSSKTEISEQVSGLATALNKTNEELGKQLAALNGLLETANKENASLQKTLLVLNKALFGATLVGATAAGFQAWIAWNPPAHIDKIQVDKVPRIDVRVLPEAVLQSPPVSGAPKPSPALSAVRKVAPTSNNSTSQPTPAQAAHRK